MDGLCAVARMAKRLKIPRRQALTTIRQRRDVVNLGSDRHAVTLRTMPAQGLSSKHGSPHFAPLGIVPTARCMGTLGIVSLVPAVLRAPNAVAHYARSDG